jgi:putative phosphotransacetylase
MENSVWFVGSEVYNTMKIPVHLTQELIDILFGKGYELTLLRKIRQHDDFVSNETVDVAGPKGVLKNVRVVGPAREKAQVEITLTKAREIGVVAEVRFSADVENTSGVRLIGPAGQADLKEGLIAAARHLHVSPEQADALGLKEGQKVAVEAGGDRAVIFKNICVRIDEDFDLELHLDTDEANAAGLKKGDLVELLP